MSKRKRAVDDEMAMHLHDLSVNGIPNVEACARLMKATLEPSMAWLDAERDRGTLPEDAIAGMIKAHIGTAQVLAGAVTSGRLGNEQILRLLATAYNALFLDYAQHAKAGKKKSRS